MKPMFWTGLLTATLATACLATPAIAITVQDVPNPRHANGDWVTDLADVLTPQTEAELNRLIANLEAQNGSEVAVVTVPETAPAASPKAFATELFNTWGIGKANRNNGVLLLISVGDRRVELETGSGLETILPSDRIDKILQAEVIPRFRQQDFNGGTLAGTKAVVDVLSRPVLSGTAKAIVLLIAIAAGGTLVYFLRIAAKNMQRYSGSSAQRSRRSHSRPANSPTWWHSDSSHSSYSSSDSGSSDFGGGSSDGGGGGGDW